MKYVLKNAEFITALNMLTGMLHMETNTEILDVNFKTSIFGGSFFLIFLIGFVLRFL